MTTKPSISPADQDECVRLVRQFGDLMIRHSRAFREGSNAAELALGSYFRWCQESHRREEEDVNKPGAYDGRGYDPPYPTADEELDNLRAQVEGLTAERDHYREAVARQGRIIAGLRGAVVVLKADALMLRVRVGSTMAQVDVAEQMSYRADAIRAAARRGEYRGKR